MLLERILYDQSLHKKTAYIVKIIISHMSVMLSLVNDMLDIKMIKAEKF